MDAGLCHIMAYVLSVKTVLRLETWQEMTWFFSFVRPRAILSHFENKDVVDVGGTERCCDNCTRRSVGQGYV